MSYAVARFLLLGVLGLVTNAFASSNGEMQGAASTTITGRGGDSDYLAELLRHADSAKLAERREWQALLHDRATLDGTGALSDIDDSRFFLAPAGRTDPHAELAATLRAFFTADEVGGDPQPAQCAFRARYKWLRHELTFDDHRLPPQLCARFQQWLQQLDAESATLVFTSAYLNNPASLFGHTLLRLDRRNQTEQTRLLAYAVNYAANDSGSRGLMYAVNGMTGGFQGQFNIQPYYQLVRTYSDLESRDIWEYHLNLSKSQFQRLLEHIWELRGIHFDYYFLKENCAWQLLTLLEVADPNLRLSDQFVLWTLPPDTLRLLVQQSDLVGAVSARPARGTSIRRRYEALNTTERQLVRRLRNDPAVATEPRFVHLTPERQALLLELALDERQHRRAGSPRDKKVPPPDPIAHHLLIARNQRPAATPVEIEPYATRPETGHASRRIGLGFGQRDGTNFLELSARASYHDLLEPDAGYTPDAQIELLNIALRHYADRGRLALERLTLLDITSLPPSNALNPRPAWRL
ncbi:MAG: DUF4105 domain-containing protein, partial [Phycisphaerales bacterium]|nr:DUF4105 domain-containing protein [Phycisphaerales bacterium]